MIRKIWRERLAPEMALRIAPRVLDLIRADIDALKRDRPEPVMQKEDEPAPPALDAEALPPADFLQTFRGYEADDLDIFKEFMVLGRTSQPGFIVDFLGARTRVSSLYDAVAPFAGSVQGPPLQGDYHAEAVEWIGLLKSARSARDKFVAMEWGAGWAPWLVAGATAARVKGITDFKLYGIEADPHHFDAMTQHFVDNDLPPDEHVLLKAAVGTSADTARWPKELDAKNAWGARPVRIGSGEGVDQDYLNGRIQEFIDVEVLAAAGLLEREPRWDMLHIDIQGWEGEVCRSCIELISERVKWVIIGVHSRLLDGDLMRLFHGAGFILEHEKPTRFRYARGMGTFESMVTGDGTQVWRNPRLVG